MTEDPGGSVGHGQKTNEGNPAGSLRVPPTDLWSYLFLALLALFVYWPSLDNGFISDDYIFLDRIETWVHDPFYLLEIPPENYRTTTYAAFLLLQRLFGYQPAFFYLFTILIHALNGFLLGKIAGITLNDRRCGWISSLVFIAFQSPQEAIMWLGAMHEALQGLGILLTLLCWVKGKEKAALLCYLMALFSKESAPIALLLMGLVDYWRSGRLQWNNKYLLFLIPTFGVPFMLILQGGNNSLVGGGFYRIGWHALAVWILSLHRLAFPWLYVLFLLAATRARRRLVGLAPPLLWAALALTPYIFLTYQNHVPSRHTYLASMGMAVTLSMLLIALGPRPAFVLLAVFLVANAGYIWVRKDVQYEERAAPTEDLVRRMASSPARKILLSNFPLNPWIAKMTTGTVPGWEPHHLVLPRLDPECPECPVWKWDPASRSYH